MNAPRARVAVIGAGIAGNTAAYDLSRDYEVHVFEAAPQPGGHTRTSEIQIGGQTYAVDTGFIVYNELTYPTFCGLLDDLGVATQPSDMSFGLTCERSGLEYSTRTVPAMFAQKRNLLSPSYWRIWTDFIRLGRQCEQILQEESAETTLGEYLARHGYSRRFTDHFIVPMAAAIWSATAEHILAFPVTTFVRFMQNHRMLSPTGQPQWRVIQGGSRRYVEALYAQSNIHLHCSRPVRAVTRTPQGAILQFHDGRRETFDAVVMAIHSDQALRMLADASEAETQVLGAIGYQDNEAILHTDSRVMPLRQAAWASWNYRIPESSTARVSVTYDMSRLQSLAGPERFLVTLNRDDMIAPERVIERIAYAHPVFDAAAVMAQQRWHEISGVRQTYYCGAYWRFGFHEDGAFSGMRAAQQLRGRIAAFPAPAEKMRAYA